MNLNPLKLFDPSYLFDPRPGSTFMLFWPLVVFFLLTFAGSFFVKRKNLASRMRELSVLGLVFSFLRDQNVPYLGMRVWLVLVFLTAIAYGIWYWSKEKKKKMLQPILIHQKNTMDKYLPKKKKRR